MNPSLLRRDLDRDPVTTLCVLAIEDEASHTALVDAQLQDAAPDTYSVRGATSLSAATEPLGGDGVDCVLLDLTLPDASGLEALSRVAALARDVPVVVLSGRRDEALAIRAVQEGAQDYLIKGEVDGRLLARSISYAIERKRVEVEAAHRSLHDGLTGLPNRALLLDRVGQALTRLGRRGGAVALLFCDLDRFKVVNDSLGHAAGDELLVAVASRLTAALRSGDTAARLDGDEFVVLAEEVGGEAQAMAVADRISAALEQPFALCDGTELHVRASIGIAVASSSDVAPEALVRDADAAMDRAKDRGGDGVELFDRAMRARAVQRLATETALHGALVRDELRLHFQPQIRMATGETSGVEALVRWQHPERGLLAPGEFLTVAEQTGLIHRLGAWVLERACEQSVAWGGRVPVAVNLSARQLLHPDLPATIAATLTRTGCDPRSLCFEITETAVMQDVDGMLDILESLKADGFCLAIDDFGTGYSSLRALQQFPFDVVKIDRSFVSEIGTSDAQAAIATAIISLSHALGLTCVAEGIETVEQLECLRTLECDDAQGFYFSKAVPADELSFRFLD